MKFYLYPFLSEEENNLHECAWIWDTDRHGGELPPKSLTFDMIVEAYKTAVNDKGKRLVDEVAAACEGNIETLIAANGDPLDFFVANKAAWIAEVVYERIEFARVVMAQAMLDDASCAAVGAAWVKTLNDYGYMVVNFPSVE